MVENLLSKMYIEGVLYCFNCISIHYSKVYNFLSGRVSADVFDCGLLHPLLETGRFNQTVMVFIIGSFLARRNISSVV